jgi:glycosyltransferase involved in cell wall biosynthesis
MFSLIPWELREAARSWFEMSRTRELQKARSGLSRSLDLKVGFGGVLDDGRPLHGGAVKLLALRDAMPCDERKFAVLYAVSSSLPQCAEALFKLCRARGIKILWNQNGVGYPAWAGRESERFNRPMRRLLEMADFVIYQSRFCEESAHRFLGPCDAPSEILFNPVDVEKFQPASSRAADQPLRLLAAGTHGTRDRVIHVLDMLAIMRRDGIDATLTVAGNFQWPNGERDFQNHIARRGVQNHVQRISRFSQADAASLYTSHHVLIHPKYLDPCPTVVLEAMACGLPVIGSASGGMPELVSEECGVLVPSPLDYDKLHTPTGEELADALKKALPGLPEKSAAARANAVARFSIGPWVDAHRRIMEHLLK